MTFLPVAYTMHGFSFVFHFRLGTKLAKVDNRNRLGLCLLCGLVGSVLVADWQSIGQDPCMSLNATDSTVCDSALSSGMDEICSNGTNNSSLYQHLVESCEALSSSSHQCFWNPMSRITGIFCNTCFRVCLSREKSINFYQFSLGILLLALSAPRVFVSAITSEITSVDSQVQQNYYMHKCVRFDVTKHLPDQFNLFPSFSPTTP